MKKLLFIGVIFAMILLAGCGSSSNEEEPPSGGGSCNGIKSYGSTSFTRNESNVFDDCLRELKYSNDSYCYFKPDILLTKLQKTTIVFEKKCKQNDEPVQCPDFIPDSITLSQIRGCNIYYVYGEVDCYAECPDLYFSTDNEIFKVVSFHPYEGYISASTSDLAYAYLSSVNAEKGLSFSIDTGEDSIASFKSSDSSITVPFQILVDGVVEIDIDDEDCNDCALPPACSIDDSYTSSGFDNYYIFKGSGRINNETSEEYTSNTSKSSLYLEHYPDYSLNAMHSFLFDTTMDSGQESVSLVNMGLDNSGIYPNVYLQAFMLKEWLENPSGKLPFAPIITVFSVDFHTTSSGEIDWYKMCTIAISVYTSSELLESVWPEGSFQYCAKYRDGGLIESGQIKPGQLLELGIDARLTDKFEDIQSAYNEGLLGTNDILVETPEDLCRCYSNTANSEEIDCPDKQSDEDSEQNDADVEEDSDIIPDSELSDDDAETPEQPDGDYRVTT